MGKLHTLRRAIQRDPEPWYLYKWTHWDGSERSRVKLMGARFVHASRWQKKAGWVPTDYPWRHRPYQAFVLSVLRDLGIDYGE